ncbi:unnamed protein product [Vicia faba]|uniref:Uncharacterized protein n=1 Tax=Vicia faba TaxID=3906 RepID=A0AAV0ZVU7_VICFA|nr:unnamed protein product [Vicia faba]
MHGFSTVDGFVEISECLAEMIKYVANEPSAGLFFIQQHTQNAVPNVIKLKKKVIDKSHETRLHTEDLEDSVTTVKSMKECGFPIIDDMIGDIKKTLATMTSKQPKRVLPSLPASNFQTERTSFWGSISPKTEKAELYPNVPLSVTYASSCTSTDKLPLPRQVEDETLPEQSDIGINLLSVTEKYDDFKASKQAKLEEWLEGTNNHDCG